MKELDLRMMLIVQSGAENDIIKHIEDTGGEKGVRNSPCQTLVLIRIAKDRYSIDCPKNLGLNSLRVGSA